MIRGIKLVSIPVTDQDRALAFWTERVGFVVATDAPFDDRQRWIELGIPGADTRLVLFTPEGHEGRVGRFSSVTFLADDVDRTYAELSARGVPFDAPPRREDWGSAAIFRDPDGTAFVLASA